jgi:hypothetical protein
MPTVGPRSEPEVLLLGPEVARWLKIPMTPGAASRATKAERDAVGVLPTEPALDDSTREFMREFVFAFPVDEPVEDEPPAVAKPPKELPAVRGARGRFVASESGRAALAANAAKASAARQAKRAQALASTSAR